jgi:hypothetical protein
MLLTTIFPPVMQTVWSSSDPAVHRIWGHFEGAAWRVDASAKGLITRGPRLDLSSGLYGIEYQITPGSIQHDPDTQITVAQIVAQDSTSVLAESSITYGMIARPSGGMYGGTRLTVMLDQPRQAIELRLYSPGAADFSVLGFKLVPRAGQVWFPAELPHSPEAWRHHLDRSATCTAPTTLAGPSISLSPGEYRGGIKLMPPPGMLSGNIAFIDVVAGEQVIVAETLVSAEQTLANFAIPDAKMRFRLNEYTHSVDLRVRTLIEGVTVQWVRLATDDEATWHHYYNMGGSASVLGLPINAFRAVEPSLYGLRGSARTFEHGAIYWTIEHGPCEVYGDLFTVYVAHRETHGALGFPISRPKRDRSGLLVQTFEGGTLSSNA